MLKFSKMLRTVAIFLSLVAALPSFSQSTRGAITGQVQDTSGAVVSGADVTLSSPSQGTKVTTRTNGAGVYRFDSLVVGEYIVSATAPNFGKIDSPASVTVGALVGRDFQLKPAGATGAVEVTTTRPDIQTEEAVRVQVIPAESLAELPIPGQNSLNLILTSPGVVRANNGTGGSGPGDSGIGSVNGARPRSNNFLLDGINNNDISVTGPQFVLANNDALQEVSFQTSNFTAEYGRAGGAVVSQVTKSGTNTIHGTLAETYRSELFLASTQTQRNAYFPALTAYQAALQANPATTLRAPILVPKFKENIPAFTIGGPVYIPKLYDGRDKTFFFSEGLWDRYSSGGSQASFTVPTVGGVATLQTLASTCPNVAAYLVSLGPARGANGVGTTLVPIDVQSNLASTTCNGNARTGQTVETGTFTRAAPEISLEHNYLIKLDHIASQKQNMMFRYIYDTISDTIGGNIGINSQFDVPSSQKYRSGNFNHTYSFSSSIVNEFRFGFSRAILDFSAAPGTLGSIQPAIGFATTQLSSLQLSATFPQGRTSNTFQYEDTVTVVRGRHAFKLGTQLLRQLATQQAPYNSRGTVTYGSNSVNGVVTNPIQPLANFIDNFAGGTGAAAVILFGSGRYHPNLFTMSFYAQDTYKATPTLTLTYGLRYENFGQPANIFKLPSFVGLGATDYANTDRVKQANKNFGPSVGFAYSPTLFNRPGAFVLRGGYQLTYDTFFNNLLSNMAAGAPNTQSSAPITLVSNAATPRGLSNFSSVLPGLTAVPVSPYTSLTSQFKQGIRNPYYNHFSLGVQTQISGGVVLDVAYVGTLGRQLFFTNNENPQVPDATFSTYATQTVPLYGLQNTRQVATRGLVQPRESGLTSNYNSLQIQVRRRQLHTFAGTLNLSSSYTWSKNLDVLSEVFALLGSGSLPSKPISQYGPAIGFDYGPSDNDRKHVSVTTMVMDFRGVHNSFLNQVVGGWTAAPILQVTSGQAYNLFNGTDRDLDGTTSNDRPNIGNVHAPINTRAVITSTSNCASGYYDPNLRTSASVLISQACVAPGNQHFVQAPVYQPFSPTIASRNQQYTSRYLDLDLNILKKFSITEQIHAEVRGEFFNVTNNQNFDTPNAPALVSSAGNTFQNYGLVSGGNRSFRVGGKILF